VSLPDIINGLFEMSGGFFLLLSVKKLLADKVVRGVSWLAVGFFATWSGWNLYFYASLDQWVSWTAGIWLLVINCWYLYLLVHFTLEERKTHGT